MKRLSYQRLNSLPMDARNHVCAVNYALNNGQRSLTYTVARRVAEALSFLRWQMRDGKLTYSCRGGGSITIEQNARIASDHAIGIAYMTREGIRIAGSRYAWSEALDSAMRHVAEDSQRNAA